MDQLQNLALIGVQAGQSQKLETALKQVGVTARLLDRPAAAAWQWPVEGVDGAIVAFPACRADLIRLAELAAPLPVIALVDDEPAGLEALRAGAWDFLLASWLAPDSVRQALWRAGAQQQRLAARDQREAECKSALFNSLADGLLNRVIAAANIALDSADILELVCHELARIFQVPQVAAMMLDATQGNSSVVAEALHGGAPSLLGRAAPAADNAVYDYLRRYGIPLFIADSDHTSDLAAARNALLRAGCGSSMFVPLTVRNVMAGAIVINAYGPREYPDDVFSLLASAGYAVSQALENSQLHRQLTLHNAELERMVAERTADLRQMGERVSAILNGAGDAIMLVQADGIIEMANPAFRRLFSCQPDDEAALSLCELVEAQHCAGVMNAVQRVLADGQPCRLEVQARRRDGALFDADMTLTRIDQGRYHVVCSLRDISQLKEVERVKDRFMSMVSHELRTPITTIVLSAGALRQYFDRMSDEQRRQAIARTDQQAQVLAELVESILDLSRLEGRRGGKRAAERVDVRALARAAVAEFLPSAASKSQALTLEAGDAPLVLLGEEADFLRIWRNLIGNAVKYTPAHGQITVRLSHLRLPLTAAGGANGAAQQFDRACLPADLPTGDYLLGQVADTGHGIPPEDFERLFVRFQRGWASQSSIPGTGLGLALVREVLNLYGGGIDVASVKDAGSVFSFWIPVGKVNP